MKPYYIFLCVVFLSLSLFITYSSVYKNEVLFLLDPVTLPNLDA